MAITNVVRGPFQEIFTITANSLPGGGAAVVIPTQIRVPRDQVGVLTRALQRCRAIYKETGVVGAPDVGHPVLGLSGDLVTVTLTNNGAVGSASTGELEVEFLHSVVAGVDSFTPGTLGFAFTIHAAGAGAAPSAADIYLDVTLGAAADGRVGDSFVAGHPIGTWAEAARRALAVIRGTTGGSFDVTIFVTASGAPPAGDVVLDPELVGNTRFHIVHPVIQWLSGLAGNTVAAASITAEPGSGFAVIPVVGAVLATANDRGLFLELQAVEIADPTHIEIVRPMIVSATPPVGAPPDAGTYVVEMLEGALPAVFNDVNYTVTAVVRQPRVVAAGTIFFAPKAVAAVMPVAGVISPENWAFGIRADNLVFGGCSVAYAGCQAWAAGGAGADGYILHTSPTGVVGRYNRLAVGPSIYHLTDAKAQAWGAFSTTAAFNGCCMGNAALAVAFGVGVAWGQTVPGGNIFGGCVENDIIVSGTCGATLVQYRARVVRASGAAQVFTSHERVMGTLSAPALQVVGNGSYMWWEHLYLELVATGQSHVGRALDGGHLESDAKPDFAYEAQDPGDLADFPHIVFEADAGKLTLGKLNDDYRAQSAVVLCQHDAFWQMDGDIDYQTANPGGVAGGADDSDFVIDHSRVQFNGSYNKEVPNTQPSSGWEVRNFSTVEQVGGNLTWTHGAAPADWTTAYTAGWLHIGNGSKMLITADIADGGVGGGAGIGIQIRRASQLWCGVNSDLTGAAPVKVGVAAAIAFPTGLVFNDLPVAPAGAEELCIIGPLAYP
jgi:hypothetical protein